MNIKPYNVFLICINLLSVFFILQIELEVIGLFNSHFDNGIAKKINGLILNISLGIIVSSLFYIVVVVYPNFLKKKSAYKVIQPRLDTIGNALHHSINYFLSKRIQNENVEIEKLSIKNFNSIDKLTSDKMNLTYKIRGNHGDWIPFSSGEQTEISFFLEEKAFVCKKIDEIFALPLVTFIDDELLEALAKLRDSWFYSGTVSYSKHGQNVTVHNFYKGVFDYYSYYITIKKYAKISEFQVVN